MKCKICKEEELQAYGRCTCLCGYCIACLKEHGHDGCRKIEIERGGDKR